MNSVPVSLKSRSILLGITGGIAAYKSAELVRLLTKAGADVRVVMTRAAKEFITPLTMQALSGNPVHDSLLDPEAEAGMGHIELAKWADLIIVAPASADAIARITHGLADDLLTTLCLATDAPLLIAPAMNQAMWRDAATQRNIRLLSEEMPEKQVHWIGPDQGSQACGDVGPGRMMEPMAIFQATAELLAPANTMTGLHLVITAGPTREPLDPVRYITNHSSGKMGYALAAAAVAQGAQVTLISGPVNLPAPAGVDLIDVETACDMHDAVHAHIAQCDIFIASAAVADYRAKHQADQKMKKSGDDDLVIELEQNPDIVASVAKLADKPFTVGFAAETHDVINYAKGKLERKNLDMIVANDVANTRIGFNSDNNAVTVVSRDGEVPLPEQPKTQLAQTLVDMMVTAYRKK